MSIHLYRESSGPLRRGKKQCQQRLPVFDARGGHPIDVMKCGFKEGTDGREELD